MKTFLIIYFVVTMFIYIVKLISWIKSNLPKIKGYIKMAEFALSAKKTMQKPLFVPLNEEETNNLYDELDKYKTAALRWETKYFKLLTK